MKIIKRLVLACIAGFQMTLIQACPTCASSLDDTTPPFFRDDFYTPNKTGSVQEKQELVSEEGEENEEMDSAHIDDSSVQ